MSKPRPLDAIAQITITLYDGGMVSTAGNIGDKPFAVALLQHALDQIKAQARPEDGVLYIPSRDVVVPHGINYPVKPLGDM